MSEPRLPEAFSALILQAAIREERATDLLECLFDGGSATIDSQTGALVLATKEQLDGLLGLAED